MRELKQVDLLKGCVRLQQRLDWFDAKLTWLHTSHTGWKKWYKTYFVSKWNSERVVMAGIFSLVVLCPFVGLVPEFILDALAVGVVLGAPILTDQAIERTRLLGPHQWSGKSTSCEIAVLDALMQTFVQRHPDLARPFVAQLQDLKHKGLTTGHAASIAYILKEYLNISKDDAIVQLVHSNRIDVDAAVVDAPTTVEHKSVLRL